jgi:hypothetical protein
MKGWSHRSVFCCGMLLLLSAGCIVPPDGSDGLAFVVIEDAPIAAVHAATMQVFHDELYDVIQQERGRIVFERAGNLEDRVRWSQYGESGLCMEVVVSYEPLRKGGILVKADAYILRQKGSRSVAEKVAYSGRRPYQTLLKKIRKASTASR